MIQIYLSDILCNVETDEVGADEPYALVTAVNLESGGLIPAFEVVRYGPFQDVDKGEKHLAPGISRSFWNLNNTPATLADPDDVIFVVALMENDDGNPETLRGFVKGLVAASLTSSSTFDRNGKITKLINDVNSALLAPTGIPSLDEKVGDPQLLQFSLAELNQAEAGQAVRKTLSFEGDGGSYMLGFEARNPVPFSGDLMWYKHNGWLDGSVSWANNGSGVKVGNGWLGFKSVFATSDGAIYGIKSNGDLMWYKHKDWQIGIANWVNGSGVKVGSGWQNFKSVFATSNGTIYAVQPNGDLMWHRHDGWPTGSNSWANGGSGVKVGNGWLGFKFVFATSKGVVYGVQPNGDLLWYKHNGWQNGTSSWANGSSNKVGSSWQNFKSVFATSDGIIYGVQQSGDLQWYRHNGWQNGSGSWANGSGIKVGTGWQQFKSVFATSRIPLPSQFGPECVIYGIQL